jgi:hypothetical protein
MQIIENVFYLGPHAAVVNFDTGDIQLASKIATQRQLEEDPSAELLSYHEDPLIIIPSAMIVGETDADADIVTSETNQRIQWVMWEGGDGNCYMVRPNFCYDAEHQMQLVQ